MSECNFIRSCILYTHHAQLLIFFSVIYLYIKKNIYIDIYYYIYIYSNLNIISYKTLNKYILIYKIFFIKNSLNR